MNVKYNVPSRHPRGYSLADDSEGTVPALTALCSVACGKICIQ